MLAGLQYINRIVMLADLYCGKNYVTLQNRITVC